MVRGTDLLVANFYHHTLAAKLIQLRVQTGKPWCFWGERPGYTRWARLGPWYRRVTLAALHRSRAPIWGIGHWAVDRYPAEFGAARAYFNVPYFSDLGRFMVAAAKRATSDRSRRFLFPVHLSLAKVLISSQRPSSGWLQTFHKSRSRS